MIALYIFAGICGLAGLLYTIIYPINWWSNLLATIFGLLFPTAVLGYYSVVMGYDVPFSMNTWPWWGWLIISLVDVVVVFIHVVMVGDEFTLPNTTAEGIEKFAIGMLNYIRYNIVLVINLCIAMAIIANVIG